jgi:flavin reductase (DIM6/NTAB) family NADH-FMN oxidoreductase RutF
VIDHRVVGDHDVFFGQVVACRDRDGAGLAFNAGKFGGFADFGHDELDWRF